MKKHFDQLWREAGGTGPAPGICSRDIRNRVDAALGRETGGRRNSMKHQLRVFAVAAVVTALLAGSALAASNWNVLSAYFRGDTAPASPLLDETVRRVEDDNYILTVESSASDGNLALLLLRVEAKNQETADFLRSDEFNDMDTWSFRLLRAEPETKESGGDAALNVFSFGIGEVKERRTETSQTWKLSAELDGTGDGVQARVRLGWMEEGLSITVPLSYVQPVTVAIGAEGPGMGSLKDIDGGPVEVEQVILSPFYMETVYRCLDASDDAEAPLFFLFQDGSLLTRSQLVEIGISGNHDGWGNHTQSFRLRSVLDLDALEAVVFNNMAYPLDGGADYAYPVDERLQAFQIPLMPSLGEGLGWSLSAQALCEGLGASYTWDEDTQAATMVFRDVEIVLTAGSTTALVDGQPMELDAAPILQDGQLVCVYTPFEAWQLDMCTAYERYVPGSENNERVAWLICP
ncbi:MAG: copper amine oxidase N-terminal domain-containing protein [Flavonifractor sp.]|nr:copper amine oxidase N-terminal domain-containing protein [Flavonifractor sp.]